MDKQGHSHPDAEGRGESGERIYSLEEQTYAGSTQMRTHQGHSSGGQYYGELHHRTGEYVSEHYVTPATRAHREYQTSPIYTPPMRTCTDCRMIYPQSKEDAHLKLCPGVQMDCRCKGVKRSDLSMHINICPNMPIRCEKGCGFMVGKIEMDAHECMQFLKQKIGEQELENELVERQIRSFEAEETDIKGMYGKFERENEQRSQKLGLLEGEVHKYVFICGSMDCVKYGFYHGYDASQKPERLSFTCRICEKDYCRKNCISRCVECVKSIIPGKGGEQLTCKNCCFNHCEHCNRQDRTYCVKHTMSCSLPHCGKIIGDCCRIICMITKHIICPSCAVKCKKCSKTISIDMAVQCSGCAGDQTGYLCRDTCALTCAWENCGQVMCPECSSNCKVCRKQICRNCQRKCGCCKIGVVCQGENCLLYCNQLKHQTAEDAQICKDCLFMICPECKNICKNCKAITHMTTLPIPGWSNLDLMVKDLSLNEEVQGHVSEIFTAMWHNKHITSVFFSMHNIYIYIYI